MWLQLGKWVTWLLARAAGGTLHGMVAVVAADEAARVDTGHVGQLAMVVVDQLALAAAGMAMWNALGTT